VADDETLGLYVGWYIIGATNTEQPEDVPITMMRLVVEGRRKTIHRGIEFAGTISYFTVNINV
jgi:hypothetical protein